MRYPMALTLLALTVAACNGGDATGSVRSAQRSDTRTSAENPGVARSGELSVKKQCVGYVGQAGGTCTIWQSNVAAVEVGSTITYLQPAGADGMLNSDVILDPPGPGNNAAFGHCSVNLGTGYGNCAFAGGTGKYQHFHAAVAVSPLGWPNFAWTGRYWYVE